MKMLLWFLRQEFLSHPSPPLYFSPLLGAAETLQQQQRASIVAPPPGYQLHLQVETKQSKTRCQLCQRILPDSQFGPGASPHPVAFQHPNSTHDRLAGVCSGRGISLHVSSTFMEGREFQSCFPEQHWATQHHWQLEQAENNNFFVSGSNPPITCFCLLTFP